MPSLWLQSFTMPIKSATTVVLLRKALSKATGAITLTIAPERLFGEPIRFFTIHWVTPV